MCKTEITIVNALSEKPYVQITQNSENIFICLKKFLKIVRKLKKKAKKMGLYDH